MKKSRYTEEQIAFALKQAEMGTPVAEVIRRMGVSEQTFYRWKKVYGGLGVGELRRVKQLEDENRKLKQLVADLSLDKHILQDVLAKKLFREHFNPEGFLMVEPSAGEGAFLKLLTGDRLAFDLEPKCHGIDLANFLEVEIACDQPIAMIGNPPFGRNSSLAKEFFNHSARQAMVIAMILPRTFRKASVQNALNRSFHLFRDVDVPNDAFTFRSKRQSVPAVFQIWTRSEGVRELRQTERTHADFEFTGPEGRVAARRVERRAYPRRGEPVPAVVDRISDRPCRRDRSADAGG